MNLFFDLDGTLTDPKEGIVNSINHTLKKFDIPPYEPLSLERFIGPPLKDTFRTLLSANDDETLAQAVAWYREQYFVKGYLENYVYDDIPQLLESLNSKHRLFVATYKRSDIATSVLTHFNLAPYFEDIYGCDLDISKAELLENILTKLNLTAADCLMIGDRKGDIEAARANGIPVVGVLWGYGTREELIANSPDYIASSPSELLHIIDKLAQPHRSVV